MKDPSFGEIIREARKQKEDSQKQLASMVLLDFTYLSKLENDRAEYPPSEDSIKRLAKHLDLPNVEQLTYLAGRIPQRDEDFIKQHYKDMPALFRRMQQDPDFATKVLREATQPEDKEEQS